MIFTSGAFPTPVTSRSIDPEGAASHTFPTFASRSRSAASRATLSSTSSYDASEAPESEASESEASASVVLRPSSVSFFFFFARKVSNSASASAAGVDPRLAPVAAAHRFAAPSRCS